jgi:hypothetical protein
VKRSYYLYYVGGICVVGILLGIGLFVVDPAALNRAEDQSLASLPVASTTVPFTILVQGATTVSLIDRENYRIQNPSDFQSLWTLVYGDSDLPRIPTVDFTKYEVLAVFDGSHATSGYQIKVQSVADLYPSRTVTIQHLVPGSGCAIAYTTTSPFEIIQVPITTLTLMHIDVEATSTCS